jgi:hypothetical protein
MSLLVALKKLVLGETWLLPLGIAAVVLLVAFVLRPALGDAWDRAGGFALLAGVIVVVVASVQRGSRGPR